MLYTPRAKIQKRIQTGGGYILIELHELETARYVVPLDKWENLE